jgi:nucleotide-binding universal stress UspA family protein
MNIRPGSMRPDVVLGDDCSSILVAVSGDASGWQALDWAAAESAARRCPLDIVHVLNDTARMLDPLCVAALATFAAEARHCGAWILDNAIGRARIVAPDVVITTHLAAGCPAVVRAAYRDDALIVVGRGRCRRLRFQSRASRIARRARGPVAIVELDGERRPGPSAGRVVLGIDDSAGPPQAVAYAFRAASRRGVGLTVIHVYRTRAGASGRRRGAQVVDDVRKLAAIDRAVQEYGAAFPDVDVRRRFVAGSAGPALLAESHAAALLVIGARPHGRLQRARLGPVARTAVRSARCSIVIIRTRQAASGLRRQR